MKTTDATSNVIAQNSKQGERVLNQEVKRRELTPAELKVNELKAQMKEAEAEARKQKEEILATIKAQQDALKLLKVEEKKTKEAEKARLKAERDAKKASKVDVVVFTRMEAVGETLKAFPGIESEEACAKADALYVATTSKKSNLKETKWAYNLAVRFLKGYTSVK
jgi:hypothetical protein